MAIQADRAPLAESVASTRLTIIVALGVERACFDAIIEAGRRDIAVLQSGPGAERAAAAARAAVATGTHAILSFGLAGALSNRATPGTVVLPERVLSESGSAVTTDPKWRASLHERLAGAFELADGALFSASRVLEDVPDKARVARAYDASACDLESAAIGAVATDADLPFMAVRVVADAADDALPDGVASWVDHAGNSRLVPVLGVVSRPKQWGATWTLIRRYGVARRVMGRLASHLARDDFARRPSVER